MNKQFATPLSTASRKGFWPAVTALTAVAVAVIVSAIFGLQVGNAEANTPAAAPPATPVSVATIAQTSITAWDEFFIPLIFSRSGGTSTLTLGITQAAVDPQFQSVIWGNEAAMGLIVTVPVFVLAMAFQKQIVEGLMAGALKG